METTAYTWETLATVGGATAATLLIVQYIKAPLDKLWKIPTRVVVWIIAFLILLGAKVFISGFVLDDLLIIVVNAFVVALAAMGSYEVSFAKSEKPPGAEG